jgi:hypothetical protein
MKWVACGAEVYDFVYGYHWIEAEELDFTRIPENQRILLGYFLSRTADFDLST